ncbi:MAG TPA: DUF6152 family protein [Terriglobales bacterium]|jgi:hypothetical protein|nr:DUF6152 family protein [Terriglobales bacterium]
MRNWLTIIVAVLALLAVSAPAFAHHGAAAYDMSKPLQLKGAVVTRYIWANPHTLVFFDAKDDKGGTTHWSVELGSPSAIALMGWNRSSLKPGDVITVYMFAAKNGNPVGRINKIVLADGTLLRDSQTGADNGGRADNDVK